MRGFLLLFCAVDGEADPAYVRFFCSQGPGLSGGPAEDVVGVKGLSGYGRGCRQQDTLMHLFEQQLIYYCFRILATILRSKFPACLQTETRPPASYLIQERYSINCG